MTELDVLLLLLQAAAAVATIAAALVARDAFVQQRTLHAESLAVATHQAELNREALQHQRDAAVQQAEINQQALQFQREVAIKQAELHREALRLQREAAVQQADIALFDLRSNALRLLHEGFAKYIDEGSMFSSSISLPLDRADGLFGECVAEAGAELREQIRQVSRMRLKKLKNIHIAFNDADKEYDSQNKHDKIKYIDKIELKIAEDDLKKAFYAYTSAAQAKMRLGRDF